MHNDEFIYHLGQAAFSVFTISQYLIQTLFTERSWISCLVSWMHMP